MKEKNIQDFFNKMKTDNEFQDRILGIKDIDERLAAIKTEGFEFNKDEVLQLLGSLTQLINKPSRCMPYYYREKDQKQGTEITEKSLQDFLNKMKIDNEFHDMILGIEDINDRLAAIRAEGFKFNKDEVLQLLESIMQSNKDMGEIPGWICCLSVDHEVK